MKEQKRTPPEYIETEYGLIQIEETTSRGEPVRLYRHDGAFSSGTRPVHRKAESIFRKRRGCAIIL